MIRALELPGAIWRKSSRSQNGSANCVEVAHLTNTTAVRDSKNPTGPVLVFSTDVFGAFLQDVRNGRQER